MILQSRKNGMHTFRVDGASSYYIQVTDEFLEAHGLEANYDNAKIEAQKRWANLKDSTNRAAEPKETDA